MNNAIPDFFGSFDQWSLQGPRAKIRPNKIFTTFSCQTGPHKPGNSSCLLDYFPFSHLFFEPKTCASCLTRNVFLRMLYLYVFHGLRADVTETWNFSRFPWYLCSGWFRALFWVDLFVPSIYLKYLSFDIRQNFPLDHNWKSYDTHLFNVVSVTLNQTI